MKTFVSLLIIIFCITLAVVIGNRMSTEAMAVVIGVVCGVVASIPMSIIVLLVMGRLGRQPEATRAQGMPAYGNAYPPVVIIGAGGQGYGLHQPAMPPPGYAMMPQPRQFQIIGDEAE